MSDVIILIIVFFLMVLASAGARKHFKGEGSCCSQSSASNTVKKIDNPSFHMRLTVSGMHCASCEERVRKALDSISGAAVSYISAKRNLVILDANREISSTLVEKVIEKEGYRLDKIENR